MGAFRREQADLAAAGLPERIAAVGTLLAPDGSLSTQDKNDLAFAVVSNPGNRIAARLGIVNAPTEPARVAQLQLGLDLIAANADGTVTLPLPLPMPQSWTATTYCAGSMSTAITAPAPNPSRSSTPSTSSTSDRRWPHPAPAPCPNQ
jgi:hypothetical protein